MGDNHDADDDAVDGNDTGKDDRENALHDDLGLHDTERRDAERRLGNAVCRAKVGEAHGKRNAERAKERRVHRAQVGDGAVAEEVQKQRERVHLDERALVQSHTQRKETTKNKIDQTLTQRMKRPNQRKPGFLAKEQCSPVACLEKKP